MLRPSGDFGELCATCESELTPDPAAPAVDRSIQASMSNRHEYEPDALQPGLQDAMLVSDGSLGRGLDFGGRRVWKPARA
jgi:hypothetical protein